MSLTSTHNPIVQKLRRAVETGRPLENGLIAAEGPHLAEEAIGSRWRVHQIFYTAKGMERHQPLLFNACQKRIEVTELSERAFQSVSGTEQNQGIISLLAPRTFAWNDVLQSCGPLVILDGIQDPGNAGAIIRSAEAFGAAGIVLTEGCVRISNGKLLRAAAGSLFRLALLDTRSPTEILAEISSAKRSLFALAASGALSLFDVALNEPFALVVGSEGAGVSPLMLAAAQTLRIPTRSVESLNAAIACSIMLYEAARQQR